MSPFEKRAVSSLAMLYAMRMLGLFMVLPVFVLYSEHLTGATPVLIGLAIGIYGLSQALFQIPFGSLSDRFGRRPMIFAGLFLFVTGSIVSALASDIETMIFGRFLQGAGAIASVLMAFVSDVTSDESRTKAMALIGMSIGISFSLALVLGPLLASWGGLSAIFWMTAVMATLGIIWLAVMVPEPVQGTKSRDTRVFKDQITEVLKKAELLRLNLGIFTLHMVLTAMFIAVPVALSGSASLESKDHWWVYLTVMILSFFAMVPFIIVAEKKRKMKTVFVFAIAILAVSSLSIIVSQSDLMFLWFSLFFFFFAFNLLEASLPSLVSKISPAGSKGTAMGVYSTCQFLGAFIGGVVGGGIVSQFGISGVFCFSALALLFWLGVALKMENPNPETGLTLSFDATYNEESAGHAIRVLSALKGVEEVVTVPGEKVAYLKVVKSQLDEQALEQAKLNLNELLLNR